MKPPPSGSFGPTDFPILRSTLPRFLAEAMRLLGGRKSVPPADALAGEIVLLFDSSSAAERAHELIQRLHRSTGVKLEGTLRLVGFHAAPGQEGTPELTVSGMEAGGCEALAPAEICAEMRQWVGEWLAMRHSGEAFALIVPLDAAHPDPHVLEEAKLSAAVCHGLVRMFEPTVPAETNAAEPIAAPAA